MNPSRPIVSVVVPVWNPGPYLDRCVKSLLKQTLPVDDIELIFVDDGSTDGTAERLDDLAREHRQLRVIHEPNSGWSGRPRNIGIDASRGRWIQFVDQDDRMAPDALRRLTTLGDSGDVDIVLGKVTSDFRPVDHDVYAVTRTDATLLNAPLIQSLTPHKMFRRDFLIENGFRFAEGKRRLEDQLFMVQTYLKARAVAILGDYNCYSYLRRDDGGNAGSRSFDAEGYFGDLRQVLDAVEEGTEPGPIRDLMLTRFLHSEILRRVADRAVLKWSTEQHQDFVRVTRALVADRFPAHVQLAMPAFDRLALTSLANGDDAALIALATLTGTIRCGVAVGDIRAAPDGWQLDVTAAFVVGGEKGPLELIAENDQRQIDPALLKGVGDGSSVDVTTDVAKASAAAIIQRRGSRLVWFVPAEWSAELKPTADGRRASLEFHGRLDLSVLGDAARDALTQGTWDLKVRMRAFGLTRTGGAQLAADVLDSPTLDPAIIGTKPVAVIPMLKHREEQLSLSVTTPEQFLAHLLELSEAPTELVAGAVHRQFPGRAAGADSRLDLVLRLEREGRDPVRAPATLRPAATGGLELVVPIDTAKLRRGRWHLRLPDTTTEVAAIEISRDHRVSLASGVDAPTWRTRLSRRRRES